MGGFGMFACRDQIVSAHAGVHASESSTAASVSPERGGLLDGKEAGLFVEVRKDAHSYVRRRRARECACDSHVEAIC
eukprot:4392403-Pleurochrysis_carterae.AAC.2